MMRRTYLGAVVSGGGKGLGVMFPDIPGVISAGDTIEELKLMAHEALQFHIEAMVESGEMVPLPSQITLDDVRHRFADPEMVEVGEEWSALIPVIVNVPDYRSGAEAA